MMETAAERDAGAAVWARALNMGDTLFKFIPVTGRFRFHTGAAVFVKTGERSYRAAAGGRTFRTGARTACFAEAA